MGSGLGFAPISFAQGDALATMANGDVVVGGRFTTAGGVNARQIARWNGTSWAPLGLGLAQSFPFNVEVNEMVTLLDGDLVVVGRFSSAGGVPVQNVARWDPGTGTWEGLGSGWQLGVAAAARLPQGDVVAAGVYTAATTCQLARLTTTCPATAAVRGTGCPSSGGANLLTAATLPWVDTTFRADGTGLPTTAIVVALTSVAAVPQGQAPLSSLFVEGLPGCDVLVAPDILAALTTTNGTVQSSLFLFNTPPLIGVTFHHQMVPIEVDAVGGWVAITATNALQLTAGSW